MADIGVNRTGKTDYGPLTGFYDPSKIGAQPPPLQPVANVSAGYSPPTTIGSTPVSAPPPPTDAATSTDPGLTDLGYPNTSDLYGLTGLDNPSSDPTGTGGSTAPGGGGGGAGSWVNDFINGITGGHGIAGSIGSMAPYLADYYLAQKQADKTQAATSKTIQPLFDQANQYLTAATKDLQLYESGKINPAQQAMIDQYAVSQKAQVAQQLSNQGVSDSGALNSAYQQIDNNAMIMKQNFVQQSLTNALSLESAGMQPLLVAIQDKLLSDTELAKTMMELTGTLASAWAYQQGQEARGGVDQYAKGGAVAGGAGVGSLINKGVSWAGSKLGAMFGGGGGGTGATASMEGLPAGAFPAQVGDIAAGDAGAGAAGAAGGAAAGGGEALSEVAVGPGTWGTAGAGEAGAAGASGGGVSGAATAAAPYAAAAALGYGIYKVGDHYNWWGNNNPSRITSTTVPKGALQWSAANGDNIIAAPSRSGAILAMQVNHGKSPGDPVIFPKGYDPKAGVGGWELKKFRRGDDVDLTNQQTGQTMNINDPIFEKTFGINAGDFQNMYALVTSSYKQ